MFRRFRDRRVDKATRRKYRENFIKKDDFIYPVFIKEGVNIVKKEGLFYQYSIDKLLPQLEKLVSNGLKIILIFGIPQNKGIEQTYKKNGFMQNSIKILKQEFPELYLIADVCLCSFSEDGHCHIGDNDKTIEVLAQIALTYAEAGVDAVAPSDMMDGRVFMINKQLETCGLRDRVKIISYAAKFASNFYGPFRKVAECAPKKGTRKEYQMDYANGKEALEEIEEDIKEGADSIIIKPSMVYADIIANAKREFDREIIAYHVSGEYAMLNSLIENSYATKEVIFETMISLKRAGSDKIITYFTPFLLKNIHLQDEYI